MLPLLEKTRAVFLFSFKCLLNSTAYTCQHWLQVTLGFMACVWWQFQFLTGRLTLIVCANTHTYVCIQVQDTSFYCPTWGMQCVYLRMHVLGSMGVYLCLKRTRSHPSVKLHTHPACLSFHYRAPDVKLPYSLFVCIIISWNASWLGTRPDSRKSSSLLHSGTGYNMWPVETHRPMRTRE